MTSKKGKKKKKISKMRLRLQMNQGIYEKLAKRFGQYSVELRLIEFGSSSISLE